MKESCMFMRTYLSASSPLCVLKTQWVRSLAMSCVALLLLLVMLDELKVMENAGYLNPYILPVVACAFLFVPVVLAGRLIYMDFYDGKNKYLHYLGFQKSSLIWLFLLLLCPVGVVSMFAAFCTISVSRFFSMFSWYLLVFVFTIALFYMFAIATGYAWKLSNVSVSNGSKTTRLLSILPVPNNRILAISYVFLRLTAPLLVVIDLVFSLAGFAAINQFEFGVVAQSIVALFAAIAIQIDITTGLCENGFVFINRFYRPSLHEKVFGMLILESVFLLLSFGIAFKLGVLVEDNIRTELLSFLFLSVSLALVTAVIQIYIERSEPEYVNFTAVGVFIVCALFPILSIVLLAVWRRPRCSKYPI